jgi:hypothetical protein
MPPLDYEAPPPPEHIPLSRRLIWLLGVCMTYFVAGAAVVFLLKACDP